MSNNITVLGIESSCDDTAVAVVRRLADGTAEVLSSVVFGQTNLHRCYGGVVPELAARAHAVRLDNCTEMALSNAEIPLEKIDLIAVTAGPGLIGGLMSGVAFAKGLAAGANKPFIGINHLAGHALTVRMIHNIEFPYLTLLVSGGHCQFLAVHSAKSFSRLGTTIDDAPGEAFDKSARILGLDQPGGPAIEFVARHGDSSRFKLPRPLLKRMGCNVSFSGLKTALLRAHQSLASGDMFSDKDTADLAASFQQAIVDVLVDKSIAAFDDYRALLAVDSQAFVVCGGVAANKAIRQQLSRLCDSRSVRFLAPPPEYCTDNGAMIAWAGIEIYRPGLCDQFHLSARSRWPLDETSPPASSFGKKGPKS